MSRSELADIHLVCSLKKKKNFLKSNSPPRHHFCVAVSLTPESFSRPQLGEIQSDWLQEFFTVSFAASDMLSFCFVFSFFHIWHITDHSVTLCETGIWRTLSVQARAVRMTSVFVWAECGHVQAPLRRPALSGGRGEGLQGQHGSRRKLLLVG